MILSTYLVLASSPTSEDLQGEEQLDESPEECLDPKRPEVGKTWEVGTDGPVVWSSWSNFYEVVVWAKG